LYNWKENMKKYSTPIRLIFNDRNGIECISWLISGVQNSHGIPVPSIGVNRLFVWDRCAYRFQYIVDSRVSPNKRNIARFALWDARRLLVHAVFVLLRPRFTLRRRRRQSAGIRSAKQRVSQGEHLEGPLGGRHHPRQVVATCCCGTPRPTWAFFLSLLCVLLPSPFSRYPLSRGSAHTCIWTL